MKTLLKRLFGRNPAASDGLTQPEREATLDLMIAAMLIDNRVSLSEDEMVNGDHGRMAWDSGTAPENYTNGATARIRSALDSSDGLDLLIASISTRLATPSARARALAKCEALLKIDGGVDETESGFLSAVSQGFQA